MMYGISVMFKNGREIDYTSGLLDLLKTDKCVCMIVDLETGEILYQG